MRRFLFCSSLSGCKNVSPFSVPRLREVFSKLYLVFPSQHWSERPRETRGESNGTSNDLIFIQSREEEETTNIRKLASSIETGFAPG